MKKIFLILSIIALSVSCTSKYEDDVVELGNRIDKLEQKIPTIEQQISAIDESITLLKQTDEALRAKDEQLATEDEKLNMAIQELEILITDLKKYVIDPGLNSTKDWAEATFYTLKQYNAAVSTLAKLEQSIASSDDATSKEISDAISALQASFQTWVGKELSGYYSIARADAEFAALRQSIESGDQTLQGEIDDVESQIANSATELEKEYQAAIKTAIEEYNGTITAELKSQLDDVNKHIDEQVAAINDKLDALEAQIGKNSEDIAKLLTRIQSLSYIHKYADGKAKMVCTSDYYSSRMSFEVSPKDAVTELEKVWKDVVSAKALGQGVDEEQFVSLPVQLVEADAQSGIITLQLSDTKLPAPIAAASDEIQVAVQISDGNTAIVSDYIPVVKSQIEGNVFIYTTKDGNIFEPIADAFDENIVSNTYDKEENIGVISFDAPITSINSIVYLADEETTIAGSDNITSIIIPNSVTTIGYAAFYDCTSLTSITIPDSVTEIGNVAFNNCTSLESITIPDSVTSIGYSAFYNCTSLTSITIPDSVTSIGMYAFCNCTSLESVTIPNSVTEIGWSAFEGCTSLEGVYISDIAAWCRIGFGKGFSNPLNYAHNLYLNGELVTNLVIPDGVTEIRYKAFENCTSLESVTIPDSVTSIGMYAFCNCTSLESVTIPGSVTEIEGGAFDGCTSLKSFTLMSATPNSNIHIPDSVTSIYVYDEFVDVYKQQWPGWADKIIPMGSCDSETIIYYDNGGTLLNLQWNGAVVKEHIPGKLVLFGRVYSLERAFANQTSLISVTIPDSVTSIESEAFSGCTSLKSVTIPDSVTSIGDSAFDNCTSLESVTIPDSVTSIGDYAFWNCTSLDSVYISDIAAWCRIDFMWDPNFTSNPLFYAHNLYLNGELVTNLVIPDGVAEINVATFSGCTSLTSVTIPDGVTKIGSSAFQNCTSLTSITIPDSVTEIVAGAFSDCTSLKDTYVNITDLAAYATSNPMHKIRSSNIHLLIDGKELTGLVIPESVIEIGWYAFQNCISLTSVTIPDSVTKIGEDAFYNCISLTSVTIGDSVTSIGKDAFYNCSSLTSVYISDLSAWCKIVFGSSSANPLSRGVTISTGEGADLYLNGSKLTDITIPSEITAIKNYAFYGCISLTSITIPDSVTSIGKGAFYGCTGELIINNKIIETNYTNSNYPSYNGWLYGAGFTKLTIGGNITKIGNYTFYGCSSLTSVTIPDSVTEIGGYAFFKCESLADVYCIAVRPPKGSTRMFDTNVPNRRIYVPAELCSAYKVYEYWSSYSNDMYPLNIAYDEIWYTSNDGAIVNPNSAVAFDANIISNTYKNGIGLIKFDKDITSIGADAFQNCTSLKSVTIPESVTSIGDRAFYGCSNLTIAAIGNNITSIGQSAFYQCRNLTSVTIPDCVTSIGDRAFEGCSSLTSIYITDIAAWCKIIFGVYNKPFCTAYNLYLNGKLVTDLLIPGGLKSISSHAFDGCSSLTSVTIPNSVTSIGQSTFYGCNNLTSATIPDSVTRIGEKAFYGCSSLTSVTISDNISSIRDHTFCGCNSLTSINIPDKVASIGSSAFSGCSSLTSVIIPDKVASIGRSAFSGCSSLTSVIIPDKVASIGSSAFSGCSSLTSANIPDRVASIEEYTFNNCSSLQDVTIGNGVTSIGIGAFTSCSQLTNIYIYDISSWCKMDVWVYDNFGNFLFDDPFGGEVKNLYLNGELITDLVIPSDVTKIRMHAFHNFASLESITIPDSVTSIETCAFYRCSSMTNITLGKNIKEIGRRAFEGTPQKDVHISDLSAWFNINFHEYRKDQYSDSYPSNPLTGSRLYINGELCTKLVIPSDVVLINANAFYRYTLLTSITIPDSVTRIGKKAFYGCNGVTSVTIGNSVTSIGDYAFSGCGLKEVYCKAITPPGVYDYTFLGKSYDCKFYVPIESVEAYKASQYWSDYSSAIYGYIF